jgi:hypothetical protein
MTDDKIAYTEDTVTWITETAQTTIEWELHSDGSLTLQRGSLVMVPPEDGTYHDGRTKFVAKGDDPITLPPGATDSLYQTLSEILPTDFQ